MKNSNKLINIKPVAAGYQMAQINMLNNKNNTKSVNAAESMQPVNNSTIIKDMLDIKEEKEAQIDVNVREWEIIEEILERLLEIENFDYTMGSGLENYNVYDDFHQIRLHLMDVVYRYRRIASHLDLQLDAINEYIEKLEK